MSMQVRNKQMSKRETEKMVKEIWKDKMVEMRAGKHTDMAEFIFQHLQKRLGIVTAVIEAGLPTGVFCLLKTLKILVMLRGMKLTVDSEDTDAVIGIAK